MASRGTIVSACIITTHTSTKNRDQARDPDMNQTIGGNQWYFATRLDNGVGSNTNLLHSVMCTAVNVNDCPGVRRSPACERETDVA